MKPIFIGNYTERLLSYSGAYNSWLEEREAESGLMGTSLINFSYSDGSLYLEWIVDISRLMSFKYPERDIDTLVKELAADIGRAVTEEVAHLSGAFGHDTKIPWGYYYGYPWEKEE